MLIVDDQALVRAGFRMILEIEPDLHVVGEAVDGDQAAAPRSAALRPDVVLMDVRMPGTDGITATRRLLADPSCQATGGDVDDVRHGRIRLRSRCGPERAGSCSRTSRRSCSSPGIRAVHSGESLLAPTVTRRMIETYLDTPRVRDAEARRRLATLTAREDDVLRLLAQGLTNAEIAANLCVSETTVKTHVGRVLTKLGLRDRVQAVIYAYETGLVGRAAGLD